MAGKPRVDYLIMSYKEAIWRFPEAREVIEGDRIFASCRFNEENEAYCLHCGEKIRLEDVKVEVLVFRKTGRPVPENDHRYWEGRVYSLCPTEGCSGSPLDWKETPWCSSKGYDEWAKKNNC